MSKGGICLNASNERRHIKIQKDTVILESWQCITSLNKFTITNKFPVWQLRSRRFTCALHEFLVFTAVCKDQPDFFIFAIVHTRTLSVNESVIGVIKLCASFD